MVTEREKLAVWDKGSRIQGENPDVYRRDYLRNKIRYASHGALTDLGWEIDHIIPLSRRGPDTIANKQPLQWEANRRKAARVLAEDNRVF